MSQFVTVGTYGDSSASGWSVLKPSDGTGPSGLTSKLIYISNSTGNDTTGNGTPATPYKTLLKGVQQLRDGFPDWLLLLKGDTWTDESIDLPTTWGHGIKGYASTTNPEPMVFTSYTVAGITSTNPRGTGTGARPIVQSPYSNNFGSGGMVSWGDYQAIVGIDFYNYKGDPVNGAFVAGGNSKAPTGVAFLNSPINWVLVEDCMIRFYGTNIEIDGTSGAGYFWLRRNVIVDTYDVTTHSEGIHADGFSTTSTDGGLRHLIIEENVIDHNGYNDSVAGGAANVFNRNMYLKMVGSMVLRGNITSRSSSAGAQCRQGGTITDNLGLKNYLTFSVLGDGNDPAAGVNASTVTNNVVLQEWIVPAYSQGDQGITFAQGADTIIFTVSGIVTPPTLNGKIAPDWGTFYSTPNGNIYYCFGLQNSNTTLITGLVSGSSSPDAGPSTLTRVIASGANVGDATISYSSVSVVSNFPASTASGNIIAHAYTGATDTNAVGLSAAGSNWTITNNILYQVNRMTPSRSLNWLDASSSPVWADPGIYPGLVYNSNPIDQVGYPDPGRNPGAYYAANGGTPNQTFTGHIVAGQLTVDTGTPTLNIGDAITWPGQTQADYIVSGTVSPYTLSGTQTVAGPVAMSSYTLEQFLAQARLQRADSWNPAYSVPVFNNYIRAGFGLGFYPSVGAFFNFLNVI